MLLHTVQMLQAELAKPDRINKRKRPGQSFCDYATGLQSFQRV